MYLQFSKIGKSDPKATFFYLNVSCVFLSFAGIFLAAYLWLFSSWGEKDGCQYLCSRNVIVVCFTLGCPCLAVGSWQPVGSLNWQEGKLPIASWMLDNKSWHVAFFSCIVFDTTSSCLVLLEIPSVGVIPDRALACLFSKQQESLDKKFFTETLFTVR